MHVRVICRRRGPKADKETTSVDRPSLVPPTDGLHHPVHAPGVMSAPPAHSVSTQTSVCPPPSMESSESAIDASAVDAACASQTDHPPQPLGLSDSAESSFSQLSRADQGTQPTVALDDTLTGDFVQAQHHKEPTTQTSDLVQAQHQREPASQNSDFQAFDKDRDAELNAAPPAFLTANMEDTMDVDTQTPLAVPSAEPCKQYRADNAQRPPLENSSSHPASSDVPIDAVSQVVDPSNLPEVDESCFSLAAALKELHKLLVVSGQGPSRASAEPFPPSQPGSLLNGSLEDSPSMSNMTGEQDTGGALLCQSSDQDTTNSAIPVPSIEGASNVCADVMHGASNVSKGPVQEVSNLSENSIQQENKLCEDVIAEENKLCDSDICPLNPADVTEPPVSSLSSAVGEVTDVNGNPIQISPEDEGIAGSTCHPEGCAGEQIPLVQPTASSPSAVERIVEAGFPLHDALLALEQADGNVELALLALLAKNIVVPT